MVVMWVGGVMLILVCIKCISKGTCEIEMNNHST